MHARYYAPLPLAALALFVVLAFSRPATAQTFFTADLTTQQETHDVASGAAGTAALVLTEDGLRYFVTVDSLSGAIANAHFHQAESGVSGSVVRGIAASFDGNTAAGIWTSADAEPFTDAMREALLAGELYLNVHTAANAAGEIRGQIRPSSGAALTATLTPDQEFADVESDASGTAHVQVTDAGAIFYLTADGLTGALTGAHFHSNEMGSNGSVVRGIDDAFEGTTAFGIWTASDAQPLTADLREALLQGRLYVNLHTAMYSGGEIRGQVLPSSGWGFYADFDADQETDAVTSDGVGTGTFTLTNQGLAFHVTVDGLTGPITDAHFHRAPAGESGGVVHGITADVSGTTASGVWMPDDEEPLTDAYVRDLLAGNIYVNVHTDAYPGGEIRGQVLPRAGTELAARLSTAQEPDDVTGPARGTANLSLTDEGLAFRVTVDGLSGPITNAHFHRGAVGVNGGVVHAITADFDGTTAAGTWATTDGLTDELVGALLGGELYLNVHTDAYPGGELRGQVLVAEGAGLRAVLTNEQAETDQPASGTAALTLTENGLVYNVTVAGLSGPITNAHFHQGAAGVSGGVIFGIFDAFDGATASGIWPVTGVDAMTDEMVTALVGGDLYINIHTAANIGGEIRGQVVPASGFGAAVQLDSDQEDGAVESDATGTASLTLTEAGLLYRLTASGLTGPILNAHFHNAPFGEAGDVVRGIGDSFANGTAEGIWRPTDEEPLTNELARELLAGNVYLNLHTAAYSSGEIRGQVRPGNVVSTAIEPVSDELPASFRLDQNYPNPFNPATTFEFALTESANATLEVFDAIGRRVATLVDGVLPPGEYQARFDGSGLPSGTYFYRLTAGDVRAVRSMVLVK